MTNSKKLISITGVATLALLMAPPVYARKLEVVSTFSIISDFAKNVGGERIALTTLIGPDSDAHTYEPKPADALAVGKADLVLANGLYFESFIDRLIRATDTTAPVIVLTKGINLLRDSEDEHDSDTDHSHTNGRDHNHPRDQATHHHHDRDSDKVQSHHHHHGKHDPHAWQSVRNAQVYVNNIAESFCAADDAGCQSYRANAKAYGKKLQALENDLKSAVADIPAARRTIITSHDAFAYLGQEYGLRFLAPQGMNTESEASAAGVAALIEQIKSREASAIFLENISNPRLIEQIASETGLTIGGKLYSDALSTENGPAATYIDMMRHNVTTIRDALLEQ